MWKLFQTKQRAYQPIDKSIWFKSKASYIINHTLHTPLLTSMSREMLKNKPILAPHDLVYNTYYRSSDAITSIVDEIKNHSPNKNATHNPHYTVKLKKLDIFHIKDVYAIYCITKHAFREYETFEDITFFQFLYYTLLQTHLPASNTFILYHHSTPIGFLNYYIFQRRMYQKTIAIHPHYQRKGLTSLLIYYSHEFVLQNNLEGIYYVFVKQGNRVDSMSKEDTTLVMQSYLFYTHSIC